MHKAKKVPEPVKIRPVRVAAQRAKELLCLMSHETQHVNWLHENEVFWMITTTH